MTFVADWRRRKSGAFDLFGNSTARRTERLNLWGKPVEVYANANLSIYSGQACNARCPFCVEELRPASRGSALAKQKIRESDDARYFGALSETLEALRPLDPTVSVTGGEASKDPRLPRILRTLQAHGARKRTMTTNGSGLLDVREGRRVVEWVAETGLRHLNVSRAAVDCERNARLMRLPDGLTLAGLREALAIARHGGTRPRLSCVLLTGEVDRIDEVVRYLEFAADLGVDNVIFRQLMKTDPRSHLENSVVRFSDLRRVRLEPLLDRLGGDPRFAHRRQIVGYYYYVEVWKYADIDVVFEEADLAQLERSKTAMPGVVHELVFHPEGRLASTWQPWDGVLGPLPAFAASPAKI